MEQTGVKLDPNDPTVKAVLDTLAKQEGRPVAVNYTVDGERTLRNSGGKVVEDPLDFAEVGEMDGSIHNAMGILYAIVHRIREMGRRVPCTRNELVGNNVSKKDIEKMLKGGYIKERLTPIVDTKTGQKTGCRATFYFTALGRGYVRKFIDSDYGVQKSGEDGRTKSTDGTDRPVQ